MIKIPSTAMRSSLSSSALQLSHVLEMARAAIIGNDATAERSRRYIIAHFRRLHDAVQDKYNGTRGVRAPRSARIASVS